MLTNPFLFISNAHFAKKQFVDTGKISQKDFDKIINIDNSFTKKHTYIITKWLSEADNEEYSNIMSSIEYYLKKHNNYILNKQIKCSYKDICKFDSFKNFTDFINNLENQQ
jgi:hypothetical protein